VHFVHPKYDEVLGHRCVPSLDDIDEPVDLVLLGVPDNAVVEQLTIAANRRDGGAVVFGPVHGLGPQIVEVSAQGDLAVCGGSCMGFVNVAKGIRAIGYVERDVLQPGPVALITHSGSVFSASLRTHRRLDFSFAVSSGQELVITAADYLDYALGLDETRCVGLFLETVRDPTGLREGLARAAERGIPIVAVAAGSTPAGQSLVTAHSGALAGTDAAWDALFDAYGVHRGYDLDELVDTLELFAIGRRAAPTVRRGGGIASVHDSGGERALLADAAYALEVPFADLSVQTKARLEPLIDLSLEVTNPLDVWGTGHAAEELFTAAMSALADDPAVSVVVVCVDLVEEYDGDESYPRAVEAIHAATTKPIVVLSTIANALDQQQAAWLRAAGIPVLEGLRTGLRALGHLLAAATPVELRPVPTIDAERRARWTTQLADGPLDPVDTAHLLSDYGIATALTVLATTRGEAMKAAEQIGYPLVLKTAEPGIDHKVDHGGVVVGLSDSESAGVAYDELAGRLGARVVVQRMINGTAELALGLVHDPITGPLVLLAAGGIWIEVLAQRTVALPPISAAVAASMVERVPLARALVDGARSRQPVDRGSIENALVSVGQLAVELGDVIAALDVNPLICGPSSAIAVDALVVLR
jgi:acyl-CoA synthetase (NDP forming)